eukprot:COSAG06_NODE_813_length_12161_cov_3.785193_7_plen_73_part_00
MFAPLAIMAAPFTRIITVWLPVPDIFSAAATASAEVSLMVTSGANLKPMRRTTCKKRSFFPVFLMFVPSLSW